MVQFNDSTSSLISLTDIGGTAISFGGDESIDVWCSNEYWCSSDYWCRGTSADVVCVFVDSTASTQSFSQVSGVISNFVDNVE